MTDQEILKIEIPPEDEPTPDPPLVAEPARRDVKAEVAQKGQQVAQQVGQSVAAAGQKAWQSDARKQATAKVTAVASSAIAKGSDMVREQVAKTAEQQTQAAVTRVRETDWRAVGKQSVADGLRWLSDRLATLATRVTAVPETPPAEKQPPQETES